MKQHSAAFGAENSTVKYAYQKVLDISNKVRKHWLLDFFLEKHWQYDDTSFTENS